jgi:alkylation response protein AidB-like acyl-CoA dehydrogenase
VVEHFDALDRLVVLDEAGAAVIAPGALDADPSPWPLDPLTPVWQVPELPGGERVLDAGAAAAAQQRGAVLTAAFALGLADRLTTMSVGYAQEREQFGRIIGSFQAVKHILADMLVRTEVARAAVYAAAAALDDPGPAGEAGAPGAASVAKVVAVEAAIANGKAATQVHGGMGFTWEVDVHLYLKRAWVLDARFGSADHHADLLGATPSA